MPVGTLLLVFGASGSGKTTLLERLRDLPGSKFTVGRKISTRPRRLNDPPDARVGALQIDPERFDVIYRKYGYDYGISSEEIREVLKTGCHYGLVIQDISSLKRLRENFSGRCVAFFVYRSLSRDDFLRISCERGSSNDDVVLRWENYQRTIAEYYENIELFDSVILNAATEEQFVRCLAHIAGNYLR